MESGLGRRYWDGIVLVVLSGLISVLGFLFIFVEVGVCRKDVGVFWF